MIQLNTSVQDIKSSVDCSLRNNHLTAHNLQDAITREKSGSNRVSVITFLNSRLKKIYTPALVTEAPLVETWEAARLYHASTNTHARLTVAAMILTGWQLSIAKKELGFSGRGRPKKNSDTVSELTWREHVDQQIPDLNGRTADRRIDLYQAAKHKLKTLGMSRAVKLLESKSLNKAQHAELEALVKKAADGDTVKNLFLELEISKAPQGSSATGGNLGGKGDNNDKEPTMEQLALSLFAAPVQDLSNLRTHSDYQKALYALPLVGTDDDPVSLTTLEHQTQSLLKDIQKAKAVAIMDLEDAK